RAIVTCPGYLPWRSEAALAQLALGDHESAERLATEGGELARAFGAPRALGGALRAGGGGAWGGATRWGAATPGWKERVRSPTSAPCYGAATAAPRRGSCSVRPSTPPAG